MSKDLNPDCFSVGPHVTARISPKAYELRFFAHSEYDEQGNFHPARDIVIGGRPQMDVLADKLTEHGCGLAGKDYNQLLLEERNLRDRLFWALGLTRVKADDRHHEWTTLLSVLGHKLNFNGCLHCMNSGCKMCDKEENS